MASTQVLHPTYSTKNDLVPAAGDGQQIQNVQETNHAAAKMKSVIVAYLLWFPPFGILGAHRFYLGQWFMGIVYIFTGGYCGIGWLADAFVLPRLVQNHNLQAKHDAAHPRELKKCPESCCRELYYCSLIDAYILTLPPFGILGIQHQYIHRPWHRLAYTVSGGLFGVGWISDFFRMPSLVKKANEDTWKLRNGMSLSAVSKESDCDVLQAYLLAIPGFFGFHHFYLGRWKIGLTYLFTLGLCGIGWLADLARMPYLVKRSNRERKADQLNTKHVDDAYLFAFPLGLLGFHHFYLNRPGWGITYFFTAGLFGIGWLVDLVRMPSLVADANLRNKEQFFIIPANTQQPSYGVQGGDVNSYIVSPSTHGTSENTLYPNIPPQYSPTPRAPYPNAPPTSQYPNQPPPQYAPNSTGGYHGDYYSRQHGQSIYPPAYDIQSPSDQTDVLKQYPPA